MGSLADLRDRPVYGMGHGSLLDRWVQAEWPRLRPADAGHRKTSRRNRPPADPAVSVSSSMTCG